MSTSLQAHPDVDVVRGATTVALGAMTGDKPIIVGTPALGQTLQVGTGFWSPSPNFSLQWYRAGYPIAGAVDYTYVVTTDDVGKAITVSQTSTVAGYQTLTRLSDPTLAIPEGTFTKPSIVAVTGTLAVGNTVTAEPGSAWSPSPDSFSYQWFRDGSPVVGSTASSYALSADDQGHLIKVTVTAHKAGYTDASVDSGADTVAKGLLNGTKPTISGSGVFGETLQASSPAWSPVANLSWQWLRNGDAITGATGTNYRLGVDDIGATVRVAVTATLPAPELRSGRHHCSGELHRFECHHRFGGPGCGEHLECRSGGLDADSGSGELHVVAGGHPDPGGDLDQLCPHR